MIIDKKILDLCTKEEIIEALENSIILNNFIVELVRAKLRANERKMDKLQDENKKLLVTLRGEESIESFLKVMKKMDENDNRVKLAMQSNVELENWLKDYNKMLDEEG